MRRVIALLLLSGAFAAATTPALAQDTTAPVVEIRLRDGSQLFGRIVTEDDTSVVLKTVSGADVTVKRDQIVSRVPVAGSVVNSEFWPDDALSSKLFLGSTGRALKRGEGYFAIDSLFLPVIQVGVTDRFSMGLGAPFWGFARTAWVTPKLQVYRGERTQVATGVLHLFVPDFGIGGYAYVAATHGTPNGAVTFGGGFLYGGEDDGDTQTLPMFSIGGERRMGRRTKFVTENYVFKAGVVTSFGVRYIGQVVSGEVAALFFVGDDFVGPPGIVFNLIWHSRPTVRR